MPPLGAGGGSHDAEVLWVGVAVAAGAGWVPPLGAVAALGISSRGATSVGQEEHWGAHAAGVPPVGAGTVGGLRAVRVWWGA